MTRLTSFQAAPLRLDGRRGRISTPWLRLPSFLKGKAKPSDPEMDRLKAEYEKPYRERRKLAVIEGEMRQVMRRRLEASQAQS